MTQVNRDTTFPVGWLLYPAFGTWIVVALYMFAAIPMLPSTEWVVAFSAFWYASLGLCVVVLCALGLALKRFFDSRQHRRARNIVVVVVALIVTAIGILMMVAIMAPLSGCC
jgi:uncharacterized membrane protein